MDKLLKYFCAVVEKNNITGAAKFLNISQPALTKSIQELEVILECKLLNRSKVGVTPTDKGRLLYKKAKSIVLQTEGLSEFIKFSEEKVQSLSIGMIDNVAECYAIEEISKLSKTLDLNLIIDNTSNLQKRVEQGDISFALATMPKKIGNSELSVSIIGEERLAIFCHKNNLESQRKHTNLISYNQSSNTFAALEEQLNSTKIRYDYILYSSSPSVMLKMLSHTNTSAILPEKYVSDKNIVKLCKSKFTREIVLIKYSQNNLPKIAKRFIKNVKKKINN